MTNKCLIKALLMFSTGFTAGWFASKKFLSDSFEERAKKEMSAYRDYILGQADGEIVADKDIPNDVVLTEEALKSGPDIKGDIELSDKIEYNLISGGYSDELNSAKSELIGKKPYLINSEEYTCGRLDFEKEALNYYSDKRLFTEDDVEVVDIDFMIGAINLSKFEGHNLGDDPDTMYVRNENIGADYEITRFHHDSIGS